MVKWLIPLSLMSDLKFSYVYLCDFILYVMVSFKIPSNIFFSFLRFFLSIFICYSLSSSNSNYSSYFSYSSLKSSSYFSSFSSFFWGFSCFFGEHYWLFSKPLIFFWALYNSSRRIAFSSIYLVSYSLKLLHSFYFSSNKLVNRCTMIFLC